MSRNNTGNPLGSKAFLDFEDNVKNLDEAVNGTESAWVDRLGRDRKSFEGMEREFDSAQAYRESRFNDFISASGYQFLGDYGPDIEFTEYNQLVRDENGEFWRVSGQVDLPYVTTGAGIPEGDALVPAGDAVLRQDLANPDKGAAMVARGVVVANTVSEMLGLANAKVGSTVQTKGYHSPGDGGSNLYEVVSAGTGVDDGGRYIDLDNGLQAMGLFPGGKITKWLFGISDTSSGAEFDAAFPKMRDAAVALNLPLELDGKNETRGGIATTENNLYLVFKDFELSASAGFTGDTTFLVDSDNVKAEGYLTLNAGAQDIYSFRMTATGLTGNNLSITLDNTASLFSNANSPMYFQPATSPGGKTFIGSVRSINDTGTTDMVRINAPNIVIGGVYLNGAGYRGVACGGSGVAGVQIGEIISVDGGSSAFYTNNVRGVSVGYVLQRGGSNGLKLSRGSSNVTVGEVDIEVTDTEGFNAIRLQGAQNCRINSGVVKTAATGTLAEAVWLGPHTETNDDCFGNHIRLQRAEGSTGVRLQGYEGLGLYDNHIHVDEAIGTGAGSSSGGLLIGGPSVGDNYINGGIYRCTHPGGRQSDSGILISLTVPIEGEIRVQDALGHSVSSVGIRAGGPGGHIYKLRNCVGITEAADSDSIYVSGAGYLAHSIGEGGTGITLVGGVGDYNNTEIL